LFWRNGCFNKEDSPRKGRTVQLRTSKRNCVLARTTKKKSATLTEHCGSGNTKRNRLTCAPSRVLQPVRAPRYGARAQDGRERTSLGRCSSRRVKTGLSLSYLGRHWNSGVALLGRSVTPLSLVTLESSRPRADDAAAAALDSLAAAAERRPHRTTIASVHLCSDAVRRRWEATAGGDALPGPPEGVWSRRVSL
jgi:hypothetical protein